MADIAQILLLPPPTVRTSATDRALAPQGQAQVAAPEDGSSQTGSADQARARRFRFRVYEGGETAQPGTDLDTRRTGSKPGPATSQIDLGSSDTLESRNGQGGRSAGRGAGFSPSNSGSNSRGSTAFLAQSIAQEQLGDGLHNPQYGAAAAAYTRTGEALTQRASGGLDISA
jgi:hypothetical protein